jgi:hypothetical protein
VSIVKSTRPRANARKNIPRCHKNQTNPYRATPEGRPAELDPLGSNTGTYNPYFNLITDPDEGNNAIMPYPSFSDLRHLGMTYSIDGISVPRDYFISTVEAHFHGSLGFALLEMSARASRPRLLESRGYYPSGQLEGNYAPADARLAVAMAFEYHGTLERDWLVTDNSLSATLNILGTTQPLIDPQDTFATNNPATGRRLFACTDFRSSTC